MGWTQPVHHSLGCVPQHRVRFFQRERCPKGELCVLSQSVSNSPEDREGCWGQDDHDRDRGQILLPPGGWA